MTDVRVFMSFDPENDGDLRDLLVEQSSSMHSGFEIVARSERWTATDSWDDFARSRIREADEVIVICGEHTSASPSARAELRIAQEEQKPYFLLWGRRDGMCTRPAGAKPADCMYSWTWEILQTQIGMALRRARSREDRKSPA